MSSSLMASPITIPAAAFHHRLCAPTRRTRLPPPIRSFSFSPNRKPYKLRITAAITPSALPTRPINSALSKKRPINSANQNGQSHDLISGSTRTVTTLFAAAVTAAKLFGNGIFNLAVQLKEPLLTTSGPAFFAAARDSPSGLNTPLTVVAAGMAKWLDLYSGVLMVRVLLSWFPNIPWDRQPMSAIRDLCDPYLNLFRNIIPPIFDTLDVSPLLAFAVLGALASILNSTKVY